MSGTTTTRINRNLGSRLLRAAAQTLVVIAILFGLAACNRSVDESQGRLCRAALPALHADNAGIAVQSVNPGPAPRTVRIDYRVRTATGPERGHFVLCTFAEEGLGLRKTQLVALRTEQRALTGASLYFLKRFWLDGTEAEMALPDVPARPALFGSVSTRTAILLQHVASALPMIALTALLASAYALIYGLAGRILLVFGEFALLGAAATSFGVAAAEWNGFSAPALLLLTGLLIALWCALWVGSAVARAVFLPILHRPGHHVMIVSVGLSLALAEAIRLAQGSGRRWLAPVWNFPIPIAQSRDFSASITASALGVTIAAGVLALALVIYMRRSQFGRYWRAASDDPLAASLMGVDLSRLTVTAFVLAATLAALSGFLLSVHVGGMGFGGGAVFGLKALVGAILGGIGSVGGALLGGLLLGVMESLWAAVMPIEWRDPFVFALLSVLLVLRPGGLFGHGALVPRQV